jgi:RNA polymerase sigma factor (sigma-70 family)
MLVTGPEDRMVLWPHVKSLPPRQRAVIVLRYYEDLSEQQIADVLGCSRGNVKSTAHHALRSLRATLATHSTEAPDGREN